MLGRIAIAVSIVFALSSAAPPTASRALAVEKGAKKKKRQPVLDYQKYGRPRKVDIQMREKRKTIREQIQTLLKYEKDDKERPGLLFRLAENYFEEAEAFFHQAMELDGQLSKDPENEALRKKVDAGKKALRGEEKKWRAKAIEQYKVIVKEHPDYPGLDKVLFYLGASLWDLERFKEALKTYKEMVSTYPGSEHVPDVYLAFGEYYFDTAKLEKSLMAYKKVAEYTESPVYSYALYKQGWCYFNLHEWAKAKDMFQSVIALADMEQGSIEVRKEALNDFTLTYSHEGSAKNAPAIFKKMAPKEAHNLLKNLASRYFGEGKDKKAVILYRYLIQKEKCSAEVPFYQGRIVDAASRVGNKRYTIGQIRELVEKFKQVQKCVKNPDARQKERIKEGRELAERTMRKLSSRWYKEAKETRQKETFEYSQEMFGDYLELFPKSKDAYDMRFVYAEMLFHRLKRFERAAAEYTKIVTRDLAYLKKHKKFPKKPAKPKKGAPSLPGTYFCDAAYKSMQAHREIMKQERRKEKKRRRKEKKKEKKKGKTLQKQPIPKYKKRFIQAAEIFLDYCPKDEDILDVKYDIAKTYYDYYHLDEAIGRFDEIVRDFPDSDLANYAANLVLDALNERQEMDKLDEFARKYFKNRKLMKHEKLRVYLTDMIPKIAFKRIGAMEGNLRKPPKGRKPLSDKRIHSRVAYAYIKFWREFGKHELADEALFNASVKYEQAERLDKARKARQLLIEKHPKSELVPGTIFNLAENFERMADFDSAADLYERYADTYKKMKGLGKAVSYKKGKKRGRRDKKKKKAKAKKEKRFEGNRRTWNLEDAEVALLNAGIYREALHQYRRAIADRLEFIDLFPRSKDVAQVYYSLGLLYERMGKFAKAADVFKDYGKRYLGANLDRALASHMKRFEMLGKCKRNRKSNRKEMDREVRTTLKLYRKYKRRKKKKQLLEAAEAAARAAFIEAEPVYADYIKYRFTACRRKGDKQMQKHFKKQLAEKVKRFKKVEKIYTDVAKLKQPEWAIASLYKIGRAYEDFAQTYYKAPLPKGLTPEQLDLYRSTLRTWGQPYEDKAVAHFGAAVKKGSELGYYSRFNRLALKKLQHYRPAEYPRERLGFVLGVVGDPASRNPLLLALWDEAKKRPELLNEPPLTTKREGEQAAPPPPAEQPRAEKPKEKPKEKPEAPGKPAEEPAEDVFEEDEPEDEFD